MSSKASSRVRVAAAPVRAPEPAATNPSQLLYSRRDVARLLGNVHVCTVMRLEKQGVLRPIRLNKHSPTAQVFFRAADVHALVEEAADAR